MATTRIGTHIHASRAEVYRLLLDADAVKEWMVPDGLTSEVHRFEPEVGGSFSITLIYDEGTSLQHDAYYGRFLELIPDRKAVEVIEFVTEMPDMTGSQTVTITLADEDGGTHLEVLHEGVPSGLSLADNETTWRMALRKLTALAERGTVD
ncbi:SRPBCC domain-containing protein [Nocardia sp. NPDC059177]|uniref:SRPBCC domain-containing protein n=1 Tax=Nocardia sp. NPDC059177 TaxID=3346759 RepID=UPI00369D4967